MDSFLREFLDEFYALRSQEERSAMLLEEPPLGTDARTNARIKGTWAWHHGHAKAWKIVRKYPQQRQTDALSI